MIKRLKKILLILTTMIATMSGVNCRADELTDVLCSPEVSSFISLGANTMSGGILPSSVGEEVAQGSMMFGLLAGLSFTVFSQSECPNPMQQINSEISDLDKRMDVMEQRINDLTVQIDTLYDDVKTIFGEMFKDLTEMDRNNYQDKMDAFDSYVQTYYYSIITLKKPDQSTYGSLKEYSQAKGFAYSYKHSPNFQRAVSNSHELISNLIAIMPLGTDAPTMMKHLNEMCRHIDGTTGHVSGDVSGDLVGPRMKGNVTITEVVMHIASRVMTARMILRDQIATVLAAATGGHIQMSEYPDLTFFNYNKEDKQPIHLVDPNKSLEDQPSAIEAIRITNNYLYGIKGINDADSDGIVETFIGIAKNAAGNAKTDEKGHIQLTGAKMFPLFQGFDAIKLKTIASSCTDANTGVIGIKEWWPNGESANDKRPFVVLSCKLNNEEIVDEPTGIIYHVVQPGNKIYYDDVTSFWGGVRPVEFPQFPSSGGNTPSSFQIDR